MYVFMCVYEKGRGRDGEDEEGNEVEHIDKDSDYVQYVTRKSVCFSYQFLFTMLLLLLFGMLYYSFDDIKNACHTNKVNLKLTTR